MSRPPERLMPRLSLTACCRMLEATERSLQAMRGRWSCLIRKKESFTGGAGVSIRSPGASWAGGARCWRVAVMAAGTSGWSSRPGWMTAAGGRAGAATPPETGDVRIPGVHAHPRDFQERAVLGPAQTDPKRLRAKLKMVNDQIKQRRCQPIPDQGKGLVSVVRGHQACYAGPGNDDAVHAFRTQVTRHWYQALRRRSQKTRLTWTRMNRIATRWLPQTQGKSPVR